MESSGVASCWLPVASGRKDDPFEICEESARLEVERQGWDGDGVDGGVEFGISDS